MLITKTAFQNIVTGILVLCATAVTMVVLHRGWTQSSNTTSKSVRYVANWEQLVEGRTVSLGSSGAPIVIIEFGDYDCSYCAKLQKELRLLLESDPGYFSLYRIPYLAGTGANGKHAAIAARCAEAQGIQENYHSALYEHHDSLEQLNFLDLADEMGATDMAAFADCLSDEQVADSVVADQNLGESLGIIGTPTLIINGRIVVGFHDFSRLDAIAREVTQET